MNALQLKNDLIKKLQDVRPHLTSKNILEIAVGLDVNDETIKNYFKGKFGINLFFAEEVLKKALELKTENEKRKEKELKLELQTA